MRSPEARDRPPIHATELAALGLPQPPVDPGTLTD